ncbi:MAG: N-acetylneuraminate synthase family protein [Candidatus Avelusimicrobium sp.]|uniref:N-acetylneuraminate synthase family protein n=1 Tax=Candidatus Avelusimicrobium sp. TaxID=3048833 RepID=UPI003F0D3CA3
MPPKYIQLGTRKIGPDFPPLVIAEMGINHNGSLEAAKQIALAAKRAGAEIIKHQTHIPEEEMSKEAKLAVPGNSPHSIWDIMCRCALGEEDERELKEYIESLGVLFLSTPFSFAAVDRLERFGVTAYKIGSGEMNNFPLVEYVARTQKPIFLSTGMNDLDEVKRAVEVITRHHTQFVLLHTTNLYPTPPNLIRLGALEDLKRAFPDEIIGLSDHSVNNLACLAATALGASVLERHFTDSKTRTGEDICCSMDPKELADLIAQSAEIARMRGGRKEPAREEKITQNFAFSSVVAARDIAPGQTLTAQDLTTKRPAGGIEAARLPQLVGKRAKTAVSKGERILWSDVE